MEITTVPKLSSRYGSQRREKQDKRDVDSNLIWDLMLFFGNVKALKPISRRDAIDATRKTKRPTKLVRLNRAVFLVCRVASALVCGVDRAVTPVCIWFALGASVSMQHTHSRA